MERYEIRVAARIGSRLAASVGCEVEPVGDAESLLVFDAPDQTALYGLLSRLRDLGIELVSIARHDSAPADRLEPEVRNECT